MGEGIMNPEQEAELQAHIEDAAYELAKIQDDVQLLKVKNCEEDKRKRLYRTITLAALGIIITMLWWGFSDLAAQIQENACLLR